MELILAYITLFLIVTFIVGPAILDNIFERQKLTYTERVKATIFSEVCLAFFGFTTFMIVWAASVIVTALIGVA